MIPFATTQYLILRPWRESDKDSLLTLLNDQRVAHGVIQGPPVPAPDALWDTWKIALSKLFAAFILEIKPEFLYMRGNDPNELDDALEPEEQKREKRKFVGLVFLTQTEVKNKDTEFAIALAFAWWGKGLGTEVLQWLMRYNFEALGMHRLTLHALGDNPRAVELYKYLGFVEEGKLREAIYHETHWVDQYVMSILDREWKERNERELDTSTFHDVVVQAVLRIR